MEREGEIPFCPVFSTNVAPLVLRSSCLGHHSWMSSSLNLLAVYWDLGISSLHREAPSHALAHHLTLRAVSTCRTTEGYVHPFLEDSVAWKLCSRRMNIHIVLKKSMAMLERVMLVPLVSCASHTMMHWF